MGYEKHVTRRLIPDFASTYTPKKYDYHTYEYLFVRD
jgi:hypothetical protein